MYGPFEPYKRAIKASGPIIIRHVYLLVNAVIFAVVFLLVLFGDTRSAIFIGIIVLVNIFLGVMQDFRARVALERLQLLTAIRVTRMSSDGTEASVYPEHLKVGDHIRLAIGDQVPCDGTLEFSHGLEVSEALLTGESDSFARGAGDTISAGSIVTTGSGVLVIKVLWEKSRIALMSNEAKRYIATPSPIQQAITTVIACSGYVLVVTIMIVIARGYFFHETSLAIVKHVGALASLIVPQGLVVITTLLFSFGAASYSRKKVLFQEINATEKLGRIKNLCMDKTGTLTENLLSVEAMLVPEGNSVDEAKRLTAIYLKGSGDSSQTTLAVGRFLPPLADGEEGVRDVMPFSSWRQFGGVQLPDGKMNVYVGSSEAFLPHIHDTNEHTWLATLLGEQADLGKRTLCVVRMDGDIFAKDMNDAELHVVALFVFGSNLREGVREAISFFQDRGITIRIISGDNVQTVSSVARMAGVTFPDRAISGSELATWSEVDYMTRARDYTVFARVLPEQKVKLIEAFKKDGFTAMVGDGANDALAIKRADLGIAMFDGAPATRSLAGVILMNNSFTALPGAVRLADNFISNIEIFASIFINQSFLGLFVFIGVTFMGSAFPLTPLNITLINYFAVGLPSMLISYWAVFPSRDAPAPHVEHFLHRIVPFAAVMAVIEALGVLAVFLISPSAVSGSDPFVLSACAVLGFIFFCLAPIYYRGTLPLRDGFQILLLAALECVFVYGVARFSVVADFFDVHVPLISIDDTVAFLGMLIPSSVLLCLALLAMRHITQREKKDPLPNAPFHFYSIIIPAHNEEKYLEETLQRVSSLDYPKESYEVIVVENGSTDRTKEIADRYAKGNIRVMESAKGVSRAKNLGLENISPQSNWVVLLDADTPLLPQFFKDFDRALVGTPTDHFSVGTTKVLPAENKSLKARAWFAFYNWGHHMTKTSFAIALMRASLRTEVHFDPELSMGEDLKFIDELLHYGKFLYLDTDNVLTSTRRFDRVGWFRLFIEWNWHALVIAKTKNRTKEYKPIR